MSLYSLQSKHLENLGPNRSVEFFRRLLWSEASRVGIGLNKVSMIDEIAAPDGGIDAIVQDANPSSDEFIPKGLSGYQIKSSDLAAAECVRELHQDRKQDKPLKSEIERLVCQGGTYVLVLFSDHIEADRMQRQQAISEEFSRLGYKQPQVRLYVTNQIMGFTLRFPSLVAWLRGDRAYGLPYETWAGNLDVAKPRTFVLDDARKGIIQYMQSRFRTERISCPVFRITGLPGLGKTRLTFEAFSPPDLRSRVTYVKAELFRSSDLLNQLVLDTNLNAIIICDECSHEDHDYFVKTLSRRGARIGLVTLSHELDTHPPPTSLHKLPPLSDTDIEKLLSTEFTSLPGNVVRRLAEFSDGYPRIAVLLAENYLTAGSSVEDILAVSDESLFTRLVTGKLDPNSDKFNKTRRVLMGLALFSKVGYLDRLSQEAQWIANLMNVDWPDFQEIVSEQKQRGIVQGEYYVYVTPFALAIYLSRQWWSVYSSGKSLEDVLGGMPRDMIDRFSERFPFVASTVKGKELVRELLSEEGVFADGSLFKTDLGENLFLKLSEADPKSALYLLRSTIGNWGKDDLLNFRKGRRGVVWALQRIAMWKEFFADAAGILLSLGEAENENYANNASGVFADLFSPAPGEMAPTEASPKQRYPVLIKALDSSSLERKQLALKGFASALESEHFIRVAGVEYQGEKPLPRLWTPRSRDEILEHYRRTWTYLEDNLERFPDEVRQRAIRVMLDAAPGLVRTGPACSEMVKTTIEKLIHFPWVNKREILETVSRIVYFSNTLTSKDVPEQWMSLRDKIAGSGFSNDLKRFVGMDIWVDYLTDRKQYDAGLVDSRIVDLAKQALGDKSLLVNEYPWLMTARAERGYKFGYELGKLDLDFTFLKTLIEEQRKIGSLGNAGFLSGYLKAVFERDPSLWENTLESLSKKNDFVRLIPELTWGSGMTDSALRRILSIADRGMITLESLGLLRFGNVLKGVSGPVFAETIRYLSGASSDLGAVIALDMVYFYSAFSDTHAMSKDATLPLLLHRAFWSNPQNIRLDQMSDFRWKEVALTLVKRFPETGVLIGQQIVENIGNESGIAGGFYSEVQTVLTEVVRENPKELWKFVAKGLGPPIDRKAFFLKEWLREEWSPRERREGALVLFDPKDIWQWVDGDPEHRAWYFASFVPPFLFKSTERICFARELLVRYGDREDVRQNLSANYSTEFYTGPSSAHYSKKKEDLLKFKSEETDGNVIRWISEYVHILDERIDRSKMEEERRGF